MSVNKIIKKDDRYYINDNQFFLVDKALGKKLLNQIKYPVLIMDTEFFNKSHDVKDYKKKIYSDDDPDMIYTICYSIAKSFKDIDKRNNKQAISTLNVVRTKAKEFDFIKQRDDIMTELFNVIIKKGIRTLIFAGESNDVKIIKNWIDKNKSIFNNKEIPLLEKDKDGNWDINTFDMYKELTQAFSFSNTNKDGSEFYDPKNLKKGNLGENTIQIPSLEKFFDYVGYEKEELAEKENIYDLCIKALRFYTSDLKDLSNKDFVELSRVIKQVKKHCHNDVLKLLYLTNFVYHFICLDDDQNKFIKQK